MLGVWNIVGLQVGHHIAADDVFAACRKCRLETSAYSWTPCSCLRFTVGWPLTDGNIPVWVHDFSGQPTVKRRLRKVPNVGHSGVWALTKIGHGILRLLREHWGELLVKNIKLSSWDCCMSYHPVPLWGQLHCYHNDGFWWSPRSVLGIGGSLRRWCP